MTWEPFFCLAVMLLTVTSCGKEVSDQTIAATEQGSEESHAAEAVMRTETTEAFSTEKAGGVGIPDDLVYAAVIHVEINPEFNLYLDAEGCIVYVEYLNEDAADLFETVDLTGQKLADGMETIVDAAEEKGYLTGQNEVTTDVVWVQEATDSGKLEKVLHDHFRFFREKDMQCMWRKQNLCRVRRWNTAMQTLSWQSR